MSQQMERLEQSLQERQSQFQLSEERLSQRVVEQLLQNTQFQSMIQTREVSMTRAETTDEHMESNPRSHRCNQMKCPCSCHLLNLNEKWKMERGAERRNNRSYSDLKTPSDFKNGTHDLYDYDHKTPNSDQRNEYGRDMSCVKEQESNDELHEVLGACGGDPGGPPSDDSSSDDNSDDGRKNKDYRSAQNKGNKKKAWVIDAAAWQICLEADDSFENQAANLLEHRKLPNQGVLNAACAKYTLSSPILKDLCKCICRYIKEKSENIVHVWAAYTYRKDSMVFGNEIVFVVLTTHNDIINEKDFSIYQRCVLDVKTKTENMKINEKELDTSNRPSATEIEDLEACLRENAKTLMKEHSELTRVTAGWYRACVNDTGQYSLQKQLCIVLYVHVKGYVPLEEKPFPTQIGKYPVDVREGIFTLCRGPNDYHEKLKMGCVIRGENQGTLGAFIEIENDGDIYGITCAHVVFDNKMLKRIIEHGQIDYRNSETGVTVYQPASDTIVKSIGSAVIGLYDEGGNGAPGMEIALIKINQDRWPTEGTFPDDSNYRQNEFGLDKPFTFCSGKVSKPDSRFHSPTVYKYGGESRLTSGEFRVNGASVRTRTTKGNILGEEMIMHDQIEIQSLYGKPFATHGDSGALVFAYEQNDSELSAVGLFEGIFEGENIYTMAPMYVVLNKLRLSGKQCALKKFAPFHFRFEDPRLGVDLYQKVSSLSENVTILSKKLEKNDQGLAKDLAKHKQEITERLQEQSEEQKRQILELKNQQKEQSEEYKKQTQEIKDQQKRESEEHKKVVIDQTTQILNLLKRQNAS
ncbi:uncharacterized protein LOC123560536 [Mercenaria mercenaria]|uniref:uncharacterized protein LOC123560536 n=1 Tax=Mercenaria mercenaria TaxID=6596 RepID=UPI00234E96E0|nr:uncharacterized protein LOC123560536 [Mercenaria mercenaria]